MARRKSKYSKGDTITIRIPQDCDDNVLKWINDPANRSNLTKAILEAIKWKSDISYVIEYFKKNNITADIKNDQQLEKDTEESNWDNFSLLLGTIQRG